MTWNKQPHHYCWAAANSQALTPESPWVFSWSLCSWELEVSTFTHRTFLTHQYLQAPALLVSKGPTGLCRTWRADCWMCCFCDQRFCPSYCRTADDSMEEIYANVESMKAVDVGPPKKERSKSPGLQQLSAWGPLLHFHPSFFVICSSHTVKNQPRHRLSGPVELLAAGWTGFSRCSLWVNHQGGTVWDKGTTEPPRKPERREFRLVWNSSLNNNSNNTTPDQTLNS